MPLYIQEGDTFNPTLLFRPDVGSWPLTPLAGELLSAPLGQSGVERSSAWAWEARWLDGGGRANPATKNDTSNAQNKHTERTLKTRTGGVRQGDT